MPSSTVPRLAALAAALSLLLPLTACAKEKEPEQSASPEATSSPAATPSASPAGPSTPAAVAQGPISGKITVYAASSLTEAFEELKVAFREVNPELEIVFNFNSSATLATQITSGAPADVFAAASPATMQTVTDAGDAAGGPTTFVRNRLEIAVPPDNPGGVTGLADFTKDDLKLGLCQAEAPCGAAADKLFAAVSLTPKPDTREKDVKTVLSKVELGEVDAALVYHTDVLAAGNKVKGIAFPESDKAVNDYPIVALKESGNAAAAAAWVAFVLSDEGDAALEDAGFEIA
jgi:molybdate transport system substrate-binding protein